MKKARDDSTGPTEAGDVAAAQWKERAQVTWRKFPGPPGASAVLRVSLTRPAYADIANHAKDSLEGEVCGILAGEFGEDDEGLFVDVRATVRGTAVRAGRGHVTFTQETWNGIHASLEKDHPKLQIVGWYHTHPGFGVEFSEMDVFIQRNFFSLPAQVALVIDPLGGDVALAMNSDAGIRYVERFWVDGREHRARVPTPKGAGAGDGDAGAQDGSLKILETRVDQLVGVVQELRASLHRFLLFAGLLAAVSAALLVGYGVYRVYVSSIEPPRGLSYVPIPLTIDGKPALIGVGVVKWDIPEELIATPPPAQGPGGAQTPVPAESPSAQTPTPEETLR